MALTKAEKKAAASADWWGGGVAWGIWKGGQEVQWSPEAAVAQLRGAVFEVFYGAGAFPGRPAARGDLEPVVNKQEDVTIAHDALVDVAKYLGYRDRGDEPAEIQYMAGMEKDAGALRARLEGLVAGEARRDLPPLPRPGLLEGG